LPFPFGRGNGGRLSNTIFALKNRIITKNPSYGLPPLLGRGGTGGRTPNKKHRYEKTKT